MRIAVISDIHGNCLALDAVLSDLRGESIDQTVCLGDAIQGGSQPAETVSRLREMACPVVMGNADAWLLTGEESGAEAPATPWMLAMREWSLSRLSDIDRAFIAAFRPTVSIDLPADQRLLCFHGSPTSFDDVILPLTPEADLHRLLGEHLPAFMCGGHTHVQQVRHLGRSFFFNPGSVGFPYRHDQPEPDGGQLRADPWVEYAILSIHSGPVSLNLRRVPLDLEVLIRVVRGSGMPEPETIVGRYRSEANDVPR